MRDLTGTISFRRKCLCLSCRQFNKILYEQFHNNLMRVYAEQKFSAHRKFNMDEPGISTVPNLVPKVISRKGKKIVCKVRSDERGQTVTVDSRRNI
jgi:hypothetical protein